MPPNDHAVPADGARGDEPDDREARRIQELRAYAVLDTAPESSFDELVRAAAAIAGTASAAVSLVDTDRQWFKAFVNMKRNQTPRAMAFCDHVVRTELAMIIQDTFQDPEFVDHPAVVEDPDLRFYAGFPLRTPNGLVLGTLCVIDAQPRELTEAQRMVLETLAAQVMARLQLRRELAERERVMEELAASETRYRYLVEQSTDVIARHRPDGSVIYVSPAIRRLLGVDPDAPDDWDLTERTHPEDVPQLAEAWFAVLAGEPRTVAGRMRHEDGDYRFLELSLRPIGIGGTVAEVLVTTRDATDRLQAAQDLAAANAEITRHRDMLEAAERLSGVGSWALDLDTGAMTWSPELHRMYGFPPGAEPDRATFRASLHPDDAAQIDAAVERSVATGEPVPIDCRITRQDGGLRWIQGQIQARFDAGGRAVGLSGISRDVSDDRRTQHELVHARDRFEQLLGAATDQAIIGTDAAGGIVIFNAGAERMLGWTRDEALGMQPWLRFHDRDELAARIAERAAAEGLQPLAPGVEAMLADTGMPVEGSALLRTLMAPPDPLRRWTWVRKDGSRITVQLSMTPMTDPDGRLAGFVGIATDVTEQVRTERERDEHAAMLRAVIENNQSIIFVKDLEGRYLLVNRAYEQTHGISEADILGQTDEVLHPEMADVWHSAMMRAVDGAYVMEEYADLPDGRHVYDAVKVPLKGPDGVVYAICGISLDVTQRRQAEQEIREALELAGRARDEALAANAAKSAFLATMSHEIRTPMNAVIGMTGLVLDTGLDDEQRDLMETVRSSGDQLLAIINDILDFSKIEAGDLDLEFRPFDLHDLVEGTLAQFASTSHGLDLISHVDEACPGSVIGDVIRLRQVLSNLVGNAVKFTADGDVLVRVQLEGHTDGGRTGDERIRLRFDVRDSGIGVPPESMDRLFKSFSQVDASTTRTYGGTGLGLAISRALVTAMGGEIWVESTPGVGSTFSFTVLVGSDPTGRGLADSHPGQAALRARLGGRRVLVVDDNATNRRILRLQLRSYGMTCVDVAGGAEALALLDDPAERFDLAVLDLMMPGMDGAELAARIRSRPDRQSLPLVLLSSVGARLREQERDFDVVLTKPVRSGHLIESLARATSPAPRLPVQASAPAVETATASGLRILLAEDNEVNQKVGRLMLGKLGHTVEIATNGVEALAAVHGQDYDVVLMDMHMPVMDGLEATRRIRAELPAERQPTIIAMTASVTLEDREACAAAGMDGYLPKPVRAGDLSATLAELAERPAVR